MFEKPFFMTLTNRCNLTCPHCYNELDPLKLKDKTSDALKRERLQVVFDKLAQQGFKKGFFTGGEALLRPDAPDILGDAKTAGLKTALFTNGHVFSEDLVERLSKAKLDEVRISLNELAWIRNRVQYERIFERQTKWISALRKADIDVGIIYIISDRNKSYFDETYQRVREMGAGMKAQPLYMPTSEGKLAECSAKSLSAGDWDEIVGAAARHTETCDFEEEAQTVVYNNPWKLLRYTRFIRDVFVNDTVPESCPTGPILVFDSEGYAHPCLFRYDLVIGHVGDDEFVESASQILDQHRDLKSAPCFREECLSAYR
ncbi:MAG: radical SAM protein [Erythrobacter sp.]|nr:radical SAM protein [Erythrobacter sp.]